jgi:hypothetical protein
MDADGEARRAAVLEKFTGCLCRSCRAYCESMIDWSAGSDRATVWDRSSSLRQHTASGALQLNGAHSVPVPPHPKTVGYTVYSEVAYRAHGGMIICGYIGFTDHPTGRALQIDLPAIPRIHASTMA